MFVETSFLLVNCHRVSNRIITQIYVVCSIFRDNIVYASEVEYTNNLASNELRSEFSFFDVNRIFNSIKKYQS